MKIAYLDCFSGISGDMMLASLVDAGVPFSVLQEAVAAVGLEASLEVRRVNRSGIDAAKVDVKTLEGELAGSHSSLQANHTHASEPHRHDHHHDGDQSTGHSHEHELEEAIGHGHVHGRSLSQIQKMIGESSLPVEVQTIALRAFRLLGEAEAKIHNVPIEKIHFHEVGAFDAIADIVAASAGCHWIAADRWICSPLNVGGGHIHCAHGVFPVPAPATLELLRDLPIYSSGVQKELVTPTGAALLRALNVTSSNFPALTLSATGYGAGSRDIPGRPNVLRLVIGEESDSRRSSVSGASVSRVGIIEAAIDDATPEILSYIADKLLCAGATDVYRTPTQMKKGRSGTHLTVLCSPESAKAMQALIFAETTTLGLRYREEEKLSLSRKFVNVETEWGTIVVKVAENDGQVLNVAPEFEDCRRMAEQHGVPLKQVMQVAIAAYWLKEVHT